MFSSLASVSVDPMHFNNWNLHDIAIGQWQLN